MKYIIVICERRVCYNRENSFWFLLGNFQMIEELFVEKQNDLAKLTDLVHDCIIPTESVQYDAEKQLVTFQLEIPDEECREVVWHCGPIGRFRVPTKEASLEIAHARPAILEAPEKIGILDINTIGYDREARQVRITTGIPGSVVIPVDDLAIRLRVTKNIIRWSRHWGLYRMKRGVVATSQRVSKG